MRPLSADFRLRWRSSRGRRSVPQLRHDTAVDLPERAPDPSTGGIQSASGAPARLREGPSNLVKRGRSVDHSPLTTHHSSLTTHHSPLTTHHSPLTTIGAVA